MWLASLASGRFAAAAAASRPQAISPNIIVFVVHGLTFMNVSALDKYMDHMFIYERTWFAGSQV